MYGTDGMMFTLRTACMYVVTVGCLYGFKVGADGSRDRCPVRFLFQQWWKPHVIYQRCLQTSAQDAAAMIVFQMKWGALIWNRSVLEFLATKAISFQSWWGKSAPFCPVFKNEGKCVLVIFFLFFYFWVRLHFPAQNCPDYRLNKSVLETKEMCRFAFHRQWDFPLNYLDSSRVD